MLFSREKDDDDDFVPNPSYRSNLASIFGNSGGDGNPTLTYTAPKQPKPLSKAVPAPVPSAMTSSESTIVVVKSVQTFKMVNEAYETQGRLGAAVICIKSEGRTIYQLLLYRNKQHQVTIAKIHREFKFHIQPMNYCTFYDKHNAIWSILFASSIELMEFSLQVALAKWDSGDSTSPMMIQDLWCPVGEPEACVAAAGDNVELLYTLHTIASVTQGLEQSRSVSVEVENSGWKQGLVGMQPNSKRLLIVQPITLEDLNPMEIAFNSPVVVKLTVVQVNKPLGPSLPPPDPPSQDQQIVPVPSQTDSSSIKGSPRPQSKAVESSESSDTVKSSPKATKADLITRMARMGQALPFKTEPAGPSDSDEIEEDHSSQVHAVPRPRTRMQHTAVLPSASLSSVVSAPAPLATPMPVIQQWSSSPYLVGGMFPAPQLQPPMESQSHLNVFFSEVRTTNSELRMGITRLTDKVEALQNKFEVPENRLGHEMMACLEKVLHNEAQVKSQLDQVLSALDQSAPRLRLEPAASSNPAAVSSTGPSVPEPCQRCAELDLSVTSLSEKVKKLQEDNEYLQTSSDAQKDALQNAKFADRDQLLVIEAMQKQLDQKQAMVAELNERLQGVQSEKDFVAQNLETTSNTVTELQNAIQEKQMSIDKLEEALRDSEATKLDEVRRNLQEVLDPKPVIGEHIKKILNVVYRLVKVQFEPQNKYEAGFIHSVLAETIKAVTLEYLQNGDLLVAEVRQQSLGGERNDAPRPTVSQTQSAPSVSSEQPSEMQYLKKEQRSLGSVEAKLSVVVCSEVPSENKFCTPQETSASSLYEDSSAMVNSDEQNQVEEHSSNNNQGEGESKTLSEVKIITVPVESTPSIADSTEGSSDDFQIWRPQPPPPPLFGEDEDEDDWLNI